MRKLLALRSLSFKAFGLALAGALLTLSACASEEGVTPQCTQDANVAPTKRDPKTTCNAFARCEINGQPQPPEACCVDESGKPYEGQLLNLCLYGYGAYDFPEDENNGSGGSGGAGGAGGAGGGAS